MFYLSVMFSDQQDDGSEGEVEYLEAGGNGTNLFNVNRNTGKKNINIQKIV